VQEKIHEHRKCTNKFSYWSFPRIRRWVGPVAFHPPRQYLVFVATRQSVWAHVFSRRLAWRGLLRRRLVVVIAVPARA